MADEGTPTGKDAVENIEESIGGWQGGDDADQVPDAAAQVATPGETPDEPAPDGAEIEWAGGLVKKPPTTQG